MITEDYVSFETAKLLKEKGLHVSDISMLVGNDNHPFISGNSGYEFLLQKGQEVYPTLTLQMAMKWLREVHNLHVEIRITNHSISNLVDVIKYYWIVFGAENAKWKTESTVYTAKAFDKYEEAAEAGIKYCLENLI